MCLCDIHPSFKGHVSVRDIEGYNSREGRKPMCLCDIHPSFKGHVSVRDIEGYISREGCKTHGP